MAIKSTYIIILFFLLSCVNAAGVFERNMSVTEGLGYDNLKASNYLVTKIDSVNNVYVIYASKSDSLYKIVSMKDGSDVSDTISFKDCKKIKVGGRYRLDLHSVFWDEDLPYEMTQHSDGVYYHGTLIKLERDSITDIFHAHNIKSLCMLNEE